MTIKEMLKKVDAYNDVAVAIGGDKVELRVSLSWWRSEPVGDYKSFARWIRDMYIPEESEIILKYKNYDFDKEVILPPVAVGGVNICEHITFFAHNTSTPARANH